MADLGPLRIFDSRRTQWRGRRVSFYVLGASHAACIEADGRAAIFELLSCVPVRGANEVLAASQLTAPRAVSAVLDDLTYRCELRPFALDTWTDPLAQAYPPVSQMRVAYEPPTGGVPTPLTCVAWRTGRELAIETIHTYPEENLGIHSHSRVTFAADAD